MKITYLILFVSFVSCSSKQEAQTQASFKTDSTPILNTPTPPTVDTVYKDFSGKENFSDLISFGMNSEEWNKFVAQQAKEGVFEKIDDKGWLGSYRAFNPKNQNRNVDFSLEAKFLDPVNSNGNKYEVVRLNNILQSKPMLNEVDLEYNTSVPNLVNQLVTDFISNHNLTFVAGLQPMTADDTRGTIEDYQISNELEKFANKDKIANTKKWESQTSYTESVFEGSTFYAIIKIEKVKNNQLTRDSNGDIVGIDNGWTNFSVKIRACSKTLSNIDINQFRTNEQKDEIDSKKKSNDLIEKALKN